MHYITLTELLKFPEPPRDSDLDIKTLSKEAVQAERNENVENTNKASVSNATREGNIMNLMKRLEYYAKLAEERTDRQDIEFFTLLADLRRLGVDRDTIMFNIVLLDIFTKNIIIIQLPFNG